MQRGVDLSENLLSPAAVYEIVSAPSESEPDAQTIVRHNGVLIYFVSYENNGFQPKDFEIPVGNSARFVNNSNKAMRIWSKNQSAPYNVLNQPSSLGKGQFYTFNFTTRGIWEFYNLNNPNDKGSITVY